MKYVIAIFLVIIGLLAFWGYYNQRRAESYCELWKNEQANNDYLIKQRKKDHEDTLAVSQRNKELEEAHKLDKSTFDWNYDISNSPVILRLRKN